MIYQNKSLSNRLILFFTLLLIFVIAAQTAAITAYASSATVTTTLTDGVQRGSKKTFDVIARDGNGKKIASTVTLNGAKVSANWDDADKTSYTLIFTKTGANTVLVSAGGISKTYTINYQKANKGDVIGQAVWSIELFTIGCGYLTPPVCVDIIEGETSAQALIRLIHKNGYTAFYSGTPESAFYLAYIGDGDITSKYQSRTNSYSLFGAPSSPKKLNLNPEIPSLLYPYLEESMSFFDDQDYQNCVGYIGEFAFTNGSGWMYTLNNVFPNVGFADSYLSDGDVVRVQFTLGYGADIGGSSAMGGSSIPGSDFAGGDFYETANKDRLTALIAASSAYKNTEEYKSALTVLQAVDATQDQVDAEYDTMPKTNSTISAPGVKDASSTTAKNTSSAAVKGTTNSPPASNSSSNPNSSAGSTASTVSSTEIIDSASNEPEALESLSSQNDTSLTKTNLTANNPEKTKSKTSSFPRIKILLTVAGTCGVISGAIFVYLKTIKPKLKAENKL